MFTRSCTSGMIPSRRAIVASMLRKLSFFLPFLPVDRRELGTVLRCLVQQQLPLSVQERLRSALGRAKFRRRIGSARKRCVEPRSIETCRHEIALEAIPLCAIDCRIQFDKRIAFLDELPIAHVDRVDDANLKRLDDLRSPTGDDLPRRRRNDIDLAEACPSDREHEDHDHRRPDRTSYR